jgi:hypothetical protein
MNTLNLREDYRIAYIMGTSFEKRMFDIYSGMSNSGRPPYLDDLFSEHAGIFAAIALEKNKHLYQGNTTGKREWNELFNQVWENDDVLKFEVLQNYSDIDYRDIMYDIYLYMDRNRLSYLVRKGVYQSPLDLTMVHSPVAEVW